MIVECSNLFKTLDNEKKTKTQKLKINTLLKQKRKQKCQQRLHLKQRAEKRI